MAGAVLKTFGAVAFAAASAYTYKRFTLSESSNLAERTDRIAQDRKPRENALHQLQNVTIKDPTRIGLAYFDPLRGERIESSPGPQPVFEKDDQGFRFLGITDDITRSKVRYTECKSSVIVPTESDKYALVRPIIVGEGHHCQEKELQEALLQDAVTLAVQGQLAQIYNTSIYQCKDETLTTYASCAKVGELFHMSDEIRARLQQDPFTACYFRSIDQPVKREARFHKTDAILLDIPSGYTCDDFLSQRLRESSS